MAYYTSLIVLLTTIFAVVNCGLLPVVTYGSSYAAHSVDHSLAAPVAAAPLIAAAPAAAPLLANYPAAAAPLLANYPAAYYL